MVVDVMAAERLVSIIAVYDPYEDKRVNNKDTFYDFPENC